MRKPLESYLSQMFAAIVGSNLRALDEVVYGMRRARITSEQIVQAYVPVLARRLGDAWVADTLDFARVTIGASRLQGLVRRLELDWDTLETVLNANRPACLVAVPHGVQHTLGATILAGQLRQRGVAVQLELALTPQSLKKEMRRERFSAVLLSASGADHLALLGRLVACAHDLSRSTPVILGGQTLEQTANILDITKADLATSDLDEAMAFAGLSETEVRPLPCSFTGELGLSS